MVKSNKINWLRTDVCTSSTRNQNPFEWSNIHNQVSFPHFIIIGLQKTYLYYFDWATSKITLKIQFRITRLLYGRVNVYKDSIITTSKTYFQQWNDLSQCLYDHDQWPMVKIDFPWTHRDEVTSIKVNNPSIRFPLNQTYSNEWLSRLYGD